MFGLGIIESIAAGAMLGFLGVVTYHALDIYLALTRRDYANIQIMLMYFTRHDYGREAWKTKDACQSRLFGPTISIRETYKNRFLYLSLVFKSLRTKAGDPILSFGKNAEMFLKPIRGLIVSTSGTDEAKRAEGLPYTEVHYCFCIIRDLSDDKQRKILKVIMVRKADLDNLAEYLANPPGVGNFDLFKKIAEAYEAQRLEHFLDVKITLT
jgi:hypothetical protein